MEPDTRHDEGDDEEDAVHYQPSPISISSLQENLQFQSPKPTSSSHGIAVRIHIGGVSLGQVLQSTTALVVADSSIGIAALGVCHDLVSSDFRGEQRERDDPEDNGEDVEAEDRPVVVNYWCSGLGDDDVDCDDHGCECLY